MFYRINNHVNLLIHPEENYVVTNKWSLVSFSLEHQQHLGSIPTANTLRLNKFSLVGNRCKIIFHKKTMILDEAKLSQAQTNTFILSVPKEVREEKLFKQQYIELTINIPLSLT